MSERLSRLQKEKFGLPTHLGRKEFEYNRPLWTHWTLLTEASSAQVAEASQTAEAAWVLLLEDLAVQLLTQTLEA